MFTVQQFKATFDEAVHEMAEDNEITVGDVDENTVAVVLKLGAKEVRLSVNDIGFDGDYIEIVVDLAEQVAEPIF